MTNKQLIYLKMQIPEQKVVPKFDQKNSAKSNTKKVVKLRVEKKIKLRNLKSFGRILREKKEARFELEGEKRGVLQPFRTKIGHSLIKVISEKTIRR
jgi:hypothetical protein